MPQVVSWSVTHCVHGPYFCRMSVLSGTAAPQMMAAVAPQLLARFQ